MNVLNRMRDLWSLRSANLALQVCFEMMEKAAPVSMSIDNCLTSMCRSTMIDWAYIVSIRLI